jgi:glycosyltransferase involved in cell wall biosynthesis
MRCLWISWIDPRGGRSGELIYSAHLLQAFAAAGARIDMLCQVKDGLPITDENHDGVHWHFVPYERHRTWVSLFSALPNVAVRARTPELDRLVRVKLAERRWDCVVIDGMQAGWALELALAARAENGGRGPRVIHVAHNHEETTRKRVAGSYDGGLARKMALHLDAAKAGRLERALVRKSDLVTAITPQDAARFAEIRPDRPILTLSPGYDGRRLATRRITAETPRRGVMVGSFHWVAKQMNLEAFLKAADPLFAAAGAELQIVGGGAEPLFERLRKQIRATQLVGPVDDLDPYFDSARMAIVPEEVGGGFKLKILDYVFNRLPVAAITDTEAGLPLSPSESILTFPSMEKLAQGVLRAMDDIALLNSLQEKAYAACAPNFDWAARGAELHAAVSHL